MDVARESLVRKTHCIDIVEIRIQDYVFDASVLCGHGACFRPIQRQRYGRCDKALQDTHCVFTAKGCPAARSLAESGEVIDATKH